MGHILSKRRPLRHPSTRSRLTVRTCRLMGGWRTVLRSTTRSRALKLCWESCREQGEEAGHRWQREQLQCLQRSAPGDQWAGRQRRRRARRRAAPASVCGLTVALSPSSSGLGCAEKHLAAAWEAGSLEWVVAVAALVPTSDRPRARALSRLRRCIAARSRRAVFSRQAVPRLQVPRQQLVWLGGGRCDTATRAPGECRHPEECPVVCGKAPAPGVSIHWARLVSRSRLFQSRA